MPEPTYTEADLAPERLLKHVKNLQSQVKTLYELATRLDERIKELEAKEEEPAGVK